MELIINLLIDLKKYHTQAILEAKERSQFDRKQSKSNINRYNVLLNIDPEILLNFDPELGNEILNNYCDSNIQDDFTKSCLSFIDSQELLLSEQVRSKIRLIYLPKVPRFQMETISNAFHKSRNFKNSIFIILKGVVECIWMPTFIIFSRTFKCENFGCRNKNYFCQTTNRAIRWKSDNYYLQTSTRVPQSRIGSDFINFRIQSDTLILNPDSDSSYTDPTF
ncbi:hypothetical protein Glove_212g135 [Diversispora epigaea]|uniref:MCMDC2 N-terminal domain-containing protein n=1 Tax=Diversispora epigaea TaxID=1348612 RepID=A0A397ISC8_9GLOM|nr:hypothetical protein Glove_212g135 [Diversispora epigaea]